MLISTTTSIFDSISEVTQATFNDFWVYIILIIGIVLGFFIAETIVYVLTRHNDDKDIK